MIMAATTLTDRAVVRLSGEDVRGFIQGLVTNDVTGDLPLEDDRLLREGVVGEDPLPMGVEGLAVPGGEIRHPSRLRVPLMLEEDREVGFDDIAQDARHRSSLAAFDSERVFV